MAEFQKVNDQDVLQGPARFLITPYATTLPEQLDDVVGMIDPYTAAAGWDDGGHTQEGVTMSFGFDKEGNATDQSDGNIIERTSNTEVTVAANFAEITPALVRYAYAGSADVAIPADDNVSAQTAVDVGPITTLPRFRLAILALREPHLQEVTEPDDTVRGAMYGRLCFAAELSGESSEMVIGRDELTNVPLTFKLFPDAADTGGTTTRRYFRDLFETAGTISDGS